MRGTVTGDAAAWDEKGRRYDPAAIATAEPGRPAWVADEAERPDPNRYVESECFVAGALSTMPPFASMHPAWALPFARRALEALSEWEPIDG